MKRKTYPNNNKCKDITIMLDRIIHITNRRNFLSVFLINLFFTTINSPPKKNNEKMKTEKNQWLYRKRKEPREGKLRNKWRKQIWRTEYILILFFVVVFSMSDYVLVVLFFVRKVYATWNFGEIDAIAIGAIIGAFAGGFASTYLGWILKTAKSFPKRMKEISEEHPLSLLLPFLISATILIILLILFIYQLI